MLQYNFGKKVKIDKSGTWCFCDILNRGCEPIVGMFTNGKQIIVGVYTYPAEYNGFNVTHTYKNFK